MPQSKLGPSQTVLVFFLYILGAYALAAVLCVPFGEYITQAAGVPPHKFIGRGGRLLALLAVWPLLKALHLANKQSLGYALPAREFRLTLVKGFAAGLLILTCLSLALLWLGIRVPRLGSEAPPLLKIVTQGLLGGLAVGFIEETFFRGALFSAIRNRGGGAALAVTLTSLLFAALHFIKPQPIPPDAGVTLGTCQSSLISALPALFRLENLDSFVALFLVGVFLAIVRNRTGHIAWCIGLHAGWVLVIRITHKYSHLDPGSPFYRLVGDYDGVIGWLAAGWIGLLALMVALWPQRQSD
jgi:membrane protease YdiL (CAAX protease family)